MAAPDQSDPNPARLHNAEVTTDRLDPLTEAVPAFEVGEVERILSDIWNVGGELALLQGERDLNVRVSDPS